MWIWRRAGVMVAAGGLTVAMGLSTPAGAQDLSEKSVQTFMSYAWSLTPGRFTKPDGTIIEIDKNNPDKSAVPLDMAREVIKVGRLSAHAQVCELPDEQVMNYRSLMLREENKKTWSEPQLIYMNQLHLVTVMLLTGKIALIEKSDGKGKDIVVEEGKAPNQSCSSEQKAKVKQAILTYVKSGPDLGAVRAVAAPKGAAPAAGGAAPAPASAPAKK